ncbi:hypothetical protein ABZ656_18685 [Streptomyces sp. NPDC007095]|jgi:hypothetical protein|uniref:hypothetical protein n=1 Tax=Streptomyces sp. NPDC007095 TaxID=3154482 RepID=UPI000C70F612
MHQPHRHAPVSDAAAGRPGTGPAPAALFSDPLSAAALPLPAARRPTRPPLETLTWQEPPAATEEDAS